MTFLGMLGRRAVKKVVHHVIDETVTDKEAAKTLKTIATVGIGVAGVVGSVLLADPAGVADAGADIAGHIGDTVSDHVTETVSGHVSDTVASTAGEHAVHFGDYYGCPSKAAYDTDWALYDAARAARGN